MKVSGVLLFVAAACGSVADPGRPDGGDDDEVDAGGTLGRTDVVFPPASGLTDGTTLVVRGTAEDADGIAAVRVNGVAALTSDQFATWEATVPLAAGPNELVVELEDRRGELVSTTARTITVSPNPFANPTSVAVEHGLFPTQPFFVGDDRLRAIFAVDPTTGARTLVTGQGRGTGPNLPGLDALAFDAPRNRLVSSGNGLFAIDLATGNRSAINTDVLFLPVGLALDDTRAFVISRAILGGSDFIEAVNLTTGARTTVSSTGVGTGPALMTPTDLVHDALNNRLLVVDSGSTRWSRSTSRTAIARSCRAPRPATDPCSIGRPASPSSASCSRPRRRRGWSTPDCGR
jgi:hypothetical protein